MNYESTRGGFKDLLSYEAIKEGIAPDGGLFVPKNICKFDENRINSLVHMDYHQRAFEVLKGYIDDYSDEDIMDCIKNAYTLSKFDSADIAPLHILNENTSILELWHGPTCAFKDMALQILPHFLVKAAKLTGESKEIVILVATSGDTGKAALEGFKDVEGTRVIVFFPHNGVSQIQKMQMVTQEGNNVCAIGVEGNFDDAQNGVKAILTDPEMASKLDAAGFKFSSANSINWGRLVPQIVYYFSAYADSIKKGQIKPGDKINFVVPTGNFGNILAAYYAMEMGLPVNRLICASNENNVLTDFIKTGVYDKNREFKRTISPSMDILISSNLERLLYEMTGRDAAQVKEWMNMLMHKGSYDVGEEIHKKIAGIFWGGYSTEEDTLKTIEDVYKEYGYLVDTHTAVGIDVYDKYVISTGDMTKTVIASTASPFKFNESVAKAIFGEDRIKGMNEFEILEFLSKESGLAIPKGLKDLDKKDILHKDICSKSDMKAKVESVLGL